MNISDTFISECLLSFLSTLTGVHAMPRRRTKVKPDIKPLTKYQAIWALAKHRGTVQEFDSLPEHKWEWPTGTFLQRRLAELRNRGTEQEQ